MKYLLWLFLSAYSCAIAQSFTLVAVNGDVQWEDKGTWKKAISGYKIPDNSKIKLGKGAYAALSYQNKQTLELKTEGSYSMADLQSKVNKAPSSITSKYVDFVVANAKSKPQANTMSNKGMVNRDVAGMVLLYQPPYESCLLEDMITFVWSGHKKAKEYIFVLSGDEKEMIRKETKDTLITLNLQPFNLKPNECYFWYVIPKGYDDLKSKEYCFKALSKKQKEVIYQETQDIQNDLGNTTLAKVVLASYYEDKKLYIEALNLYKQAAESGIEEYKNLYQNYLSRISAQ
jgi:hypothetical protein